jgi:cell wall-associated NlpC family hydrolase
MPAGDSWRWRDARANDRLPALRIARVVVLFQMRSIHVVPHLVIATLAAAQAPRAYPSVVRAAPTRLVAVRGEITGATLVTTAKHYIGVPYILGGTTPRAFDCSGFVRYVFAQHGILLPRTAHEQAALGEAPAPGDTLQAGDLLFFYGGQGAQHIAMYVGGDTIIHASSTGHHVRLDVLTRSGARRTWFNQRLIAVRRLLPMEGLIYVPTSAPPTYSLSTAAKPAY